MSKFSRRGFITFIGSLAPTFLMNKATGSPIFHMSKSKKSSLGVFLDKSSSIKVGQTHVYTGQEPSGQTIEVILSRTKKGLIALNGTCTHQGCTVGIRNKELICPCHGSVFRAVTGAVVLGPNGASKKSIPPLVRYKVKEKSGKIYIS